MELKALSDVLRNAGIVGAGGAGFPSYAKLDMRADTIILNCAECEPLFKLHRSLLAKFAFEIMTALSEVKTAVAADRVIIAVKPSYKEAIDAVNYHIHSFPGFEVCELSEFYPAGDEVNTIYEATGRVVKPGALPITVGTTVYNVETMLNAYYALKSGKPVSSKYLTVAGAVNNPLTFDAPVGMTFKELIALAGGYSEPDCAIINGGIMTGFLASESDVVTKTTNAILVLPRNSSIIQRRMTKTTMNVKRTMSACCQCRSCTDLCSRHLLGHPIQPHLFMRAVALGMESDIEAVLNSAYCSQCGICEMFSCPQGLSPRTLIGVAKAELRKANVKLPEPKIIPVNKDRDYKLLAMSRLVGRLGVSKYDVEAPITELPKMPKTVKIMLSQHIGVPAKATVSVGDKVKVGDVIGEFTPDKLGVPVHASIDGEVLSVTDSYIVLKGANK